MNHKSRAVGTHLWIRSMIVSAVVVMAMSLVACHNPANVTITFDNQTSESLSVSIAGRRDFEIEPNSTDTGTEYISGVDQDNISIVITTHDGRLIIDVHRSKTELESEPFIIDSSMIPEQRVNSPTS